MANLPRLARIVDARRQTARQAQLLVDRLQQQRPALGAAVLLVELRDDGLATNEFGKQDRLYGRVGAHEGLWMGEKRVRQPVSSASGAFVLSAFAHNPG